VGVGSAENPFGNGATVALTDGRILIVGGAGPDGAATNVVASFDTATNQFAVAGTLVSARAGHTATLLKDGRVLVTGGTVDGLVSTDIEIFDPSTGASALVAQMAEPRRAHVAALLLNGSVLIAGGYTTEDVVLQSAFLFDPATNAVSPTPAGMNVARASASATSLIDGRVVIIGGTNNGTDDLRSAEIYDPTLQSFTTVSTQLSVPLRGHSAVLLPHNGSVLVAGGTSNGTAQAGADLFLPAEFPDPFSWGIGQFAPTAAMNAARSSAIAGPSATEGYAVATGGGSNDVERYRFATIKTDKDDYAPGQTALITGTGWEPNEEVTLLFQEDPAVHDDYELTLTADAAGNIYHDQWAPEQHDLGVRFYLLAKGQQSGRQAQVTFLDGNNENTTLTVTCSPNPVVVGSPTTCQAQVNNVNSPALNGYPQGTVLFSTTGGLTGSFSPASCTLVQIGSTLSSSCGGVSFTPSSDTDGNIKATYDRTNNNWANVNNDFSLTVNGLVTVAVAPASVTEDGATNLVYTFSRAGSATSALYGVNFTVTGTASFSTDYTQTGAASFSSSAGTVNFAAGSSTAVVTVNPSTDSTSEPDETVILTLSSGTGYIVGTPSAATGTITDDDAAPNAPPNITTTFNPVAFDEGMQATNSGTWSDANAGDTVTLSASIGTVIKAGNNTLGTWSWSFDTTDGPAQSQTVTITADDGNGGTSQTTFSLTVNNVAPTAALGNNGPISEGSSATISFSSQADVSSVDTAAGFRYAYSCNGSPISVNTYAGASTDPSTSCAFNDNGSMLVLGRILDKDSGYRDYQTTVIVNNVAPTVAAPAFSPASTVNEGTNVTVTASFTDPGTADTHTCSVNFGDGHGGIGTVVEPVGATAGTCSASHTFEDDSAASTFNVVVTVTDDDGGANSNSAALDVNNVAPSVSAPTFNPVSPVDEGTTVTVTASFTDPGRDIHTCLVNFGDGHGGTGSVVETLGNPTTGTCSASHTYEDDSGAGTFTVVVSVTDDEGAAHNNSATLDVDNVAPTLTITAPTPGQLYASPATVNLAASFVDPGADTHTCSINWDDGSTTAGVVGGTTPNKSCTATHSFPAGAGVYTIQVTVNDGDGGTDTESVMVVVYDPSAGFVTGGGWIMSPENAYVADPTLTGKANFGFVSKYLKGATTPTGQTEFQFHAGSLNFQSNVYQWLVVSGSRAQYKGTGSLNGVPGYDFLLTATDGQLNGGGGYDRFRIKITLNGSVVYDNVPGASEDIDGANPQIVSGGSIVIHAPKK
jgi:hypothetical protein